MDALSFIPLQSGIAAASVATDVALPDGGGTSIDFSTLLALGMNPEPQAAPRAEKETEGTEIGVVPQHFLQAAADSLLALPQLATTTATSTALPDNAETNAAKTGATPATEINAAKTTAATPAAEINAAKTAGATPAAETNAAKTGATPAAETNATKTGATPAAEINATRATDATPAALPLARIATEAKALMADGTTATVVADDPANIAGDAHESIRSTQSGLENQIIEQRADAALDSQSDGSLETRLAAEAVARTGAQTHAAQIHPAESRSPLSQPSALLEVQAPVSEPGFAQALSRQVVWMVDKDAQVAELRINPPELGPVEVRLTLTQDSAAAEFVSPHAEVRAAIESAIARLREAMAEAGIQLGEASVSAESFSDRAGGEAQPRNARNGYRDAPLADHALSPSSRRAVTVTRGLVDVFA